jgi:hypothetical protein
MMMMMLMIIIIIIINSNKRIAATVYSLGTFFVSGIYVQIPCIKEIMTMIIIIIIIRIRIRRRRRRRRNQSDMLIYMVFTVFSWQYTSSYPDL